MTQIVPSEDIERIVGVPRHDDEHWARAVSRERKVYILHSRKCLESGIDLRMCPFSLALDNGIRRPEWVEDTPVPVEIICGADGERLAPDGT